MNEDRLTGWRRWVTVAATMVIVILWTLLLAGCLGDGKDGAQGAPGPQGEPGEPGESYVSYTNPASGQITTIAVDAGDNSPVDIQININSGSDSETGNPRREEIAEDEEAEDGE
jgi:hypothetical protein